MRFVATLTLLVAARAEGIDPAELVQKALRLNAADEAIAREYEMIRETIERQLGDKGEIKSTRRKTYRVIPVGGQPYQMLLRRDGTDLTPQEARREQEKMEEVLRSRAAESPEARRRRLAEYDQKWGRNREMFDEIPKAFFFRILGEDAVDGFPVWVIGATPKPEYEPRSFRTNFLKHMQGRICISKVHQRAIRIDILTTGPVSFGWFLAKLQPGTRITIEQTFLPEGVWVTRRFKMNYDVRVALIKQMRGEAEQLMWDYRRAEPRVAQAR